MAARPHAAEAGLDRSMLCAFTGILAGLNAISASLVECYAKKGLVLTFVKMGGISAGVWFALLGCYLIAREGKAFEPASRRDLAVAAILGLTVLVPLPELSSAAVLGAGLYFTATSAADSRTQRIAIVLLAVSGSLIGSKLMLALFAPAVLPIDGAIVAGLAQTAANGNVVNFRDGTPFVIGTGCSSVHNLTFALLLWGTLTQLLALRITVRLIMVCVAAMAATVAVNIGRLVTIAFVPESYAYIHDGDGALLFGWLTLMVGAVVVAAGAYVEARRQV